MAGRKFDDLLTRNAGIHQVATIDLPQRFYALNRRPAFVNEQAGVRDAHTSMFLPAASQNIRQPRKAGQTVPRPTSHDNPAPDHT
ncbi:hypothetical protein ECG_00693 [Echinococcus granulosus]|uniref:Transposase n=1 Tax=Echinococcus granulosus TaxID=6210 RepID=A0A068W8V4_ECHGR|nr:hypothetical protein ECG_00693 [Echinococcus granulosus]CDS16448.1 hypothetical protein EgrG_002019600 [Echinococcus granulosus]